MDLEKIHQNYQISFSVVHGSEPCFLTLVLMYKLRVCLKFHIKANRCTKKVVVSVKK